MKILIADDQQSFLTCYRRYLESENHETYAAKNCTQAMEIIRQERVEIGILDFDLESDRNGIDIVVETRKMEKNIPFIINTGFPGDAEDYIGKLPEEEKKYVNNIQLHFKLTLENLREAIGNIINR
jgi:DNA-binding NtrC family response regulator